MSALAPAGAAGDDDDVFELIPFGTDWAENEKKSTPKHTARRLKAADPQKYAILKAALEEGAAKTTLAKTHKVGINTLYAIIDAELGGAEAYNRSLAGKFRNAASLALDAAVERIPDEKSVAVLAMAAGIFYDKAQAASGAPGLVIEHRHTVQEESMARINAMLAEIGMDTPGRPAVGRVIEAEEVAA